MTTMDPSMEIIFVSLIYLDYFQTLIFGGKTHMEIGNLLMKYMAQ